jgi:hypothetical protein
VAHSWLGQLYLVYFWLEPKVFLSIEYEDIIDDPLFTVALSSPKYNKVLAELSA